MSDPRSADWTPERRAAAWLNIVLQSVILLALLVVVNLIARRSPGRFDMTSRRTFHLSGFSEDTLKNLSYDVEIWVNPALYGMADDRALNIAVMRTEDLLEEITKRTRKVTVKRLNVEDRADFARFRQHWTVRSPATLYILATLGTGRTNKKEIEIQQLYQGNAVTGELTSWRGDPVIVGAIRDLGGGTRRIVYESEGHQEFVTADRTNMMTLKGVLTTNEGIEVRRIALLDFKSLPDECDLLMILGPSQPFQEHELQVIRDYIERGGSLLVAVRPRVRTGLEKLLEEYSVIVGDNLVMDSISYKPPSLSSLAVRDFNVHEVNRSMVNVQLLIPDTCTVDPVERKDPKWRITPIVMASTTSWEEKGPTGPGDRPSPGPDERKGNMKLIVTVEKPAKNPLNAKHERAKIDVWGSVSPFTDGVLHANGRPQELQIQYVVNHVRWLMDREPMEIREADPIVRPILLDEKQLTGLTWVVLAGFPSFGVALGILAWFVRRK